MDQENSDEINLPPHSTAAEQAVLGGLLLDADAYDSVAGVLQENDFYSAGHRLIFSHIGKLLASNQPADVVTVFADINKAGKSDVVGGLEYINSLASTTTSIGNIRYYAEIVRDRSLLRQLARVSSEIAGDAYHPAGRDAVQILDGAEAKIFAISESHQRSHQSFEAVTPIVKRAVDKVTALYESNSGDLTGLSTSFYELDQRTGGFQNGDLIIIAGRPSMGKTAFAMNIADHVAVDQRLPVAVFSMEMSSSQLVLRMLSALGRINHEKMRNGRFSDDDWGKLSQAVVKVSGCPLYVDETPALSPIELRSRARRLAKTCGKLNLIVIDYLQLMSAHRDGENRATEISEISRSLKSLAKELDCPVIALSQLNRSVEQRPNKRPLMSDLRESGAIEQDADLILFIYRDEVYNPDTTEKGSAEIIIGKQRNGPIGHFNLTFLGEYTKFENYAKN